MEKANPDSLSSHLAPHQDGLRNLGYEFRASEQLSHLAHAQILNLTTRNTLVSLIVPAVELQQLNELLKNTQYYLESKEGFDAQTFYAIQPDTKAEYLIGYAENIGGEEFFALPEFDYSALFSSAHRLRHLYREYGEFINKNAANMDIAKIWEWIIDHSQDLRFDNEGKLRIELAHGLSYFAEMYADHFVCEVKERPNAVVTYQYTFTNNYNDLIEENRSLIEQLPYKIYMLLDSTFKPGPLSQAWASINLQSFRNLFRSLAYIHNGFLGLGGTKLTTSMFEWQMHNQEWKVSLNAEFHQVVNQHYHESKVLRELFNDIGNILSPMSGQIIFLDHFGFTTGVSGVCPVGIDNPERNYPFFYDTIADFTYYFLLHLFGKLEA